MVFPGRTLRYKEKETVEHARPRDAYVRFHSSPLSSWWRPTGAPENGRQVCRTCPFIIINSSDHITTTQGQIKTSGFFTCITSQLIYCISCRKCPRVVYIGETGCRLDDRFREHRLDVINSAGSRPWDNRGPGHPDSEIRGGGPSLQKIFFQDFSFTWLADLRGRTPTCFYARIFKFSNFSL